MSSDRTTAEPVHAQFAAQDQLRLPSPVAGMRAMQRSVGNQAMQQLLQAPPAAVDRVLRSRGVGLPNSVRRDLEQRFGHGFGDVRVHTGGGAAAAAEAIKARAFTVGTNLVFGRGEFDTVTTRGRTLLAHELAHVVQQRRGGGAPVGAAMTALEHDSGRAADSAVRGAGPVRVMCGSRRGIARQEKEEKPTLPMPRLEVQTVSADAYNVSVDGVYMFSVKVKPEAADKRFGFRLVSQDNNVAIVVEGNRSADVLLQKDALRDLAAKGYNVRVVDNRQSNLEDRGSVELPPLRVLPPISTPKPPPAMVKATSKPAATKQELPAKPAPTTPTASAADKSTQPSAPSAPAAPTEAQQQEASDEIRRQAVMSEVGLELGEVDPLVARLAADVPINPADHALNEVRGLSERLKTDEKFLNDFLPKSGSHTAEVQAALARITALRQQLAPAVAAATKWHDENSPGKSLGMMNEEAGTWLAGQGLEQYDKGGIHYVSGTAAFGGAFVVAFVDAAEKLISFGVHDTATAVSEAYTRGDISWNEGDRLMGKAITRALLIAAVTRGAGAVTSRLGVMSAETLGIAQQSTRFGLVAGGVSGGLQSATALGTQSLITSSMTGDFTSPQAKAIWNIGMPKGREWAVAIPLGIFLGGLGGVRGIQLSNEKLIGTTVNTPDGPMKIVSITSNGQAVLTPVGSRLALPPPPPAADILLTYDAATNSWKAPTQAVPEVPATAGDVLPPSGQLVQPGLKLPGGGGGGSGGFGGGNQFGGPGEMTAGPTRLYLPEEGIGAGLRELPTPTLEAAASRRLILLDKLGRPITVTALPNNQFAFGMDTTLLGELRMVDAAGRPLFGQIPPPSPSLVDVKGNPIASPRTGPLILDLQAGTPAYGTSLAQRIPGSQVIGVEGGNWLLAYQRVYPTQLPAPQPPLGDLNLSLQIARNSPVWPDTPAFQTSIEGMPRLLPWEMDPATHLFPQQGPMTMLADPANARLGAQFFPAVGGGNRLVPFRPADVTGVRTAPPLQLPQLADQILLRRPFGLGRADAAASDVMGQRVAQMLKPGGFVELRPTRATDIGPAQVEAIQRAMPGSVAVRVSRRAVEVFQETGTFPEGSTPIEQDMIRNAAGDVTGLGAGDFSYVIRIYAP